MSNKEKDPDNIPDAPNRFVRITFGFEEISKALHSWSEVCEKMVVYQHDPDMGCKRTHCHILIHKPSLGDEGLKKRFRKECPEQAKLIRGGQEWNWGDKAREVDDSDLAKVITYMSKGSLAPVLMKGFSQEEVEQLRLQWVETRKSSPGQEKPQKTPKGSFLEDIIQEWGRPDRKLVSFEEVRRWVFSMQWRKTAVMPHPSMHKSIAGTLYLRIAEAHPEMCLQSALEEVRAQWF